MSNILFVNQFWSGFTMFTTRPRNVPSPLKGQNNDISRVYQPQLSTLNFSNPATLVIGKINYRYWWWNDWFKTGVEWLTRWHVFTINRLCFPWGIWEVSKRSSKLAKVMRNLFCVALDFNCVDGTVGSRTNSSRIKTCNS